VNSRIKGAVVNIYPIETLDLIPKGHHEYPDSKDIRPLIEFIKLKPEADPKL
jgi:hypothetical protein